MALADTHITPARPSFAARIGHALSTFGRAFTRARAAQARFDAVQRLNAKSDAELARMGLKREDIAHHVFKDLYYA